jgi:hypothetical protein
MSVLEPTGAYRNPVLAMLVVLELRQVPGSYAEQGNPLRAKVVM